MALKVLVLTLYSGEAEYEACRASVVRQNYVNIEHICFEWLSNAEAHEAVYRTIMARSNEFDCFVKLDADMVFHYERALCDLCRIFIEVPGTDHLCVPVYDIPSDSYLMGVHLFSPRVSWDFPLDPLFPDRNPQIPGVRRIDQGLKLRVVDHMPHPSPSQAFALGVHRASKIAQFERFGKLKPADFPLSYLKRIAINKKFDKKLQHLILAGMFVTLITGRIGSAQYKKKSMDVSYNLTSNVLARLYTIRPITNIIFIVLRMRYVHLRRMCSALYIK